ncbi:MAG TPA: hypothetical protein VJ010_02830 [Actinomycetota bacterium]|nr:hypothetical protein [Actinomycetota bacterium]
MELTGPGAPDEGPGPPVGGWRRTLVEIGDLGPRRRGSRAAARQEVALCRMGGRERLEVGDLAPELDRWQVVRHVEHALRLVEQLRRKRRRHLHDAHDQGGGVENEVHMLVASGHDHAPGTRREVPRRARELRRHADVGVGVLDQGALVRAGQQLHCDDRGEEGLVRRLLDPHQRRPVAAPGDDVGGPAVGFPAHEQ